MIDLEDVDLFLPDGRRIIETKHLVLASGESVALSGPSGSGKSTLFRAIAGIWPYGDGRIRIPEGIKAMVVPPKPYIPISTLRAAVTYPAVPGAYKDDDIRRALVDAHLGDLVEQLDHEDVWSQRLSSGEQQRLAPSPRPARCGVTGCSSMSRHPLSMRSSKPRSTPNWRDDFRRRRSCPSAIALQWSGSTSATSKWVGKTITSHCAMPRRWSLQSDRKTAVKRLRTQ